MAGLELHGFLRILHGLGQTLLGQAVHQIQIHLLKGLHGQSNRRQSLLAIVYAA